VDFMDELVKKIKELKNSNIRDIVNKRISEFKQCGKSSNENIFKELCFCILTANFNAERAIKIQKEINNDFLYSDNLAKKLKELGHRFPNKRAEFIIENRKYAKNIKNIISSFNNSFELRDWLVKNIKGLGYKEASHFLRNIGYDDVAIIDFHIIDLLAHYNLIKKPEKRSLTKKNYLEIESILRKIANKVGLSLAELDLYLWYMETSKILK